MTDAPESAAPGYVGGRILDVGALTQIATGRSVYARALIASALDRGQALIVSTVALAAARATAGTGGRAQLHVLLDLAPIVPVPLGIGDAEIVGDLLATAADSRGGAGGCPAAADGGALVDVAAAHVVWLGLHRRQRIVTDRPAALRELGAGDLDELP